MSGEEIRTLVAAVMLLLGAGFGFVASVGLVRMPDLPMRLHATSKAGTLGAGLMLFGVALFHNDFGVTTRALATALFLILTGPVAAHIIARAAYFSIGMPLWERTGANELEGRYDVETHALTSRADRRREAADEAADARRDDEERGRGGEPD